MTVDGDGDRLELSLTVQAAMTALATEPTKIDLSDHEAVENLPGTG